MKVKESNIVKIVVRGHENADIQHVLNPPCINWVKSEYVPINLGPAHVVDYAYGLEGEDYEHIHEHMHFVLRMDRRMEPDELREAWDFENHPNLQDIRLGDDFEAAAKYACKGGHYSWPNQMIHDPYNLANPSWHPMQRRILDIMAVQDHRQILCVVDVFGKSGKTFLSKWLSERFQATRIPVSNDYKDLMRMAHGLRKQHYSLTSVYIDIPRSFPKKHLRQLYSAIETLKDGDCWDDRYQLSMVSIPSPAICVFTNVEPEMYYLTADRWHMMYVRSDGSIHEPDLQNMVLTPVDEKRVKRNTYMKAYMRKYRQKKEQMKISNIFSEIQEKCP